jgi:competence protein ComFC
MKNTFQKLFESALELLFPRACTGCGKPGVFLCSDCVARSPRAEDDGGDIEACFSYGSGPVKHGLWLLKYRNARDVAGVFAEPLYETLLPELARMRNYQEFLKGEELLIIPIPLHKGRLRERGYNQAELLARALTGHMQNVSLIKTECVVDVLYKSRATQSQVELKDKARRLENLKDAFAVKNTERIERKTVVLIDDVSTTGATMREAKKVLKRAGAKRVLCLAVAH